MKKNNANVLVCSTMKYNNRLKYFGEGDLSALSLLKLIYKYADYSEDSSTLIRLDTMVSELQLSYDDICINLVSGEFYPSHSDPFGTEAQTNNPPTLDDGAIALGDADLEYEFTGSEFKVNFADIDGDGPGDIVIYSLPVKGELFYRNLPVVQYQIISNYETSNKILEYRRDSDDDLAYVESFNFVRVDDNPTNPATSAVVSINATITALANSSSSIGDETTYVSNEIITVLTQEVIAPTYSDPDGDDLDAIRIDEVSDANQGVFKHNGIPVSIGQIISAADLVAGLFIHEGAVSLSESSDVFNFSVRDVGSLIWVS